MLPKKRQIKFFNSQNPIPPYTFGVANFSQEIQCKEHLSIVLLHQKFPMEDVSYLHTFLVNLKQLMLWVGMA